MFEGNDGATHFLRGLQSVGDMPLSSGVDTRGGFRR